MEFNLVGTERSYWTVVITARHQVVKDTEVECSYTNLKFIVVIDFSM